MRGVSILPHGSAEFTLSIAEGLTTDSGRADSTVIMNLTQ